MAFRERTEIETGFAPIYDEMIAPALVGLEDERIAVQRKAILIGLAIAVVGIAAAILFAALFESAAPLFILGIMALFFGWGWYSSASNRWKGRLADLVMPPVCSFLGDISYDRAAKRDFPISRVQALGLIGRYNRSRFEDRIDGTWQTVPFTLVEALLQHKSSGKNSSTSTVFDGLLYEIGTPSPAPGKILITRDFGSLGNAVAGLFKGSKGRGMPRVETGHPPFEEVFEMHAERPEAARDYLPPPFLDVLIDIGRSDSHRGPRGLRAGFDGSSFFLAIETKSPFLEMGGLGQPIGDVERDLHGIFADIARVRRLIDRLIDV